MCTVRDKRDPAGLTVPVTHGMTKRQHVFSIKAELSDVDVQKSEAETM